MRILGAQKMKRSVADRQDILEFVSPKVQNLLSNGACAIPSESHNPWR